jgi:DNA-binding CsgD family transcriptional regulator
VSTIPHAPTTSLRPGEVEAALLGEMPWGTHFCIFHETKEDMIDTFVPYFKAGLENKEFCLWVVPDSLKKEEALELLREALPDFDHYLAQESIEVVAHDEWFFKQGTFDLPTVINRLSDKSREALSRGYSGLRVNKSSAWLYKEDPRQFTAFEKELDALITNERLIMLCSFSLQASGANEVLDAARAHQLTAARRNGAWEVIETAEIKRAVQEIKKLHRPLTPFPGFELLTARERMVLAETVRGSSSKDSARTLGIGRRTIEFHRANIMQKLGVKTTVDLVRLVLGDGEPR